MRSANELCVAVVVCACFAMLLTAGNCSVGSEGPTASGTVTVQAVIQARGFIILYRDESEPTNKYVRVDLALTNRGLPVESKSVGPHKETFFDVSHQGVGTYDINATAYNNKGTIVGGVLFPGIVVNGL